MVFLKTADAPFILGHGGRFTEDFNSYTAFEPVIWHLLPAKSGFFKFWSLGMALVLASSPMYNLKYGNEARITVGIFSDP